METQLKWLRDKLSQARISEAVANAEEEALYAQAASEVAQGDIRPGLWAKATVGSDGDERKTQARYIGLRVEQLQLQLGAAAVMARVAYLEVDSTPTPETHVHCPDCRALIRRESSLCRHCGCKLTPQ